METIKEGQTIFLSVKIKKTMAENPEPPTQPNNPLPCMQAGSYSSAFSWNFIWLAGT